MTVTLLSILGLLIWLCGALYVRHLVVMRGIEKDYNKRRQLVHKHRRL